MHGAGLVCLVYIVFKKSSPIPRRGGGVAFPLAAKRKSLRRGAGWFWRQNQTALLNFYAHLGLHVESRL